MENTMAVSIAGIIMLILGLGVCAGVIILQIFLSKTESKWPGLILPIMSFCFALLISLSLISDGYATTTVMVDGEIIEQTMEQVTDLASIITSAILFFLLFNIPTGVLLATYAACRGKLKKKRALDKMQVQDLE